jgi:hypothetical protein
MGKRAQRIRKRVVFPSGDWVKFGLIIAPWVIQKK